MEVLEIQPKLTELDVDQVLKEIGGHPPITTTETVGQRALRQLSSIPEEQWCTNVYDSRGKHCALGHYAACNPSDFYTHPYTDSLVLRQASSDYAKSIGLVGDIAAVNNGPSNMNEDHTALVMRYPHYTPKQRTLAMLRDMVEAGY